jgi:hypothetical protein
MQLWWVAERVRRHFDTHKRVIACGKVTVAIFCSATSEMALTALSVQGAPRSECGS